ncbi:Type II secretion system (T2SS), protein F [uncultured archaeon]|nr:Type II secretion system (T2SS), protein F [uncultured archaeon]
MIVTAVLAVVFFSLSLLFPFGGITLRAGLILSLLPFLLLSLVEGQIMGQVSEAESELPHLLLGAASSSHFSLEKLLEQAQHMPAGPLREQAHGALRQIRAGGNPLSILSEWAASTPSVMLSRALTLLSVGWRSGGSMAKPLRALSNDALACGELVRERAAQLATQRYTLMAAGALLVPAILAVSLSFSSQVAAVSGINAGGALLYGDVGAVGASTNSPPPVSQSIAAAASVVPLYLILNSFLVALYLALATGARERFIPYAAGLVLCSQLVWMMLAPAG